MGISWQDKHRQHGLWEGVRDALAELEASYPEVEPDDERYGKVRDLLTYILGFEDFPHIMITPGSLDTAYSKVKKIHTVLPSLDGVFRDAAGNNTSPFTTLVVHVRPWPLPGAGKLTGLGRQVEALEATLRAGERRMLDVVERFEEHQAERRTEESKAAEEHLSSLTQKFGETETALQAEHKALSEEVGRIKGTLEASEKRLESHVESFEDTLKAHEQALTKQMDVAKKQWAEQLSDQESAAEEHRTAMEQYEQQSIKVLATVGTNATATDYAQYAKSEGEKADKWRTAATVAFCVAATLFVVAMVLTFLGFGPDSEWWEMVLQRIGAPAGVAGIGLFLGRESGLHREVARNAKQTELTLNALEPFIANLPEHQKQQVRYETARALFARDPAKPLDASSNATQSADEQPHN